MNEYYYMGWCIKKNADISYPKYTAFREEGVFTYSIVTRSGNTLKEVKNLIKDYERQYEARISRMYSALEEGVK